MEKLEKVLQAEDDALHALGDARETVQRMAEDARREVAEIRASAAEAAESRAKAVRAAIIERARVDAQSVRQAAVEDSREELAAAETRLPGVIERAVRGLVG